MPARLTRRSRPRPTGAGVARPGAARRLPGRLADRVPVARAAWCRMIISAAGRIASRHDGSHVRTLRHNLSAADRRAGRRRPARGGAVASYLRNVYEVLALPGWRPDRDPRRVATVNEAAAAGRVRRGRERSSRCRTAATGIWPAPGPASPGCRSPPSPSSWPDAEYAAFVAFRERLGHGGARPTAIPTRSPSWSTRSGAAGWSACSPIATCPDRRAGALARASRSPCRPVRRWSPGAPARR